jgi:thiamine-phosphate pyrophosphorylase
MQEVYRILDANLNRLREGLRVLEEVARFVLDDGELTGKLKDMRHRAANAVADWSVDQMELLCARSSEDDVGASSWTDSEGSRESLSALTIANCKRVQEASRVLEEFGKMCSGVEARIFKEIRFSAYELEKELLKKLSNKK